MAAELLASAMVMPLSAMMEAPGSSPAGSRQAWGRPTVCALPDGNTFVAVWAVGNPSLGYASARLTLRCFLLDEDLSIITTLDVMPSNAHVASELSEFRPLAYRIEDHTVWLFGTGETDGTWHDTLWVLNCSRGQIQVAHTELLDSSAYENKMFSNLYMLTDSNFVPLYLPEFNMVLMCGWAIFVFRNNQFLGRFVPSDFAFGYGVLPYRNPDDPTKFGCWFAAGYGGSIGGQWADEVRFWEYTVDPETGTITEEQKETYARLVGADPVSGWYVWQQGNGSPYMEESFWLNATDYPDSPVIEVVNARTFEKQTFTPEHQPGSTQLYDEMGVTVANAESMVTAAWTFTYPQSPGGGLKLRVLYLDQGVSPPRFTYTTIENPFLTSDGQKQWDTFFEGNSSFSLFDGVGVFASSILDDSITSAAWSAMVVFRIKVGPVDRPKVLTDDEGWLRLFHGMRKAGGRINLLTDTGWHHEWSSEDDMEDITKLRYPLRLKVSDSRWEVIAMLTPES